MRLSNCHESSFQWAERVSTLSKKTPTPGAVSTQTLDPLIQTKLALPRPRLHLVSRPRLLNILTEGLRRSLTLICAPAGYGKTTLLIDGIAGGVFENGTSCSSIGWLSLDDGDNDPGKFLSYVIAALINKAIGSNSQAGALLGSFPPPPFQTILGVLINELAKQEENITFVLDDYQFISNPIIHQGMAFFLEHQPNNIHLVILTRSDPPLPLARMRARGQLTEIRARDLQFTMEETTQLLNQITALGLTEEDISRLLDRTEGWAAGLQMAALALTSQSDTALFVKSFSGSHRYILDFLVEEVLHNQSEEIQSFLIQTSILENLSGPLCDAVTRLPSASPARSSQQILEYLERANLFLVPLDAERNWFRYHHLFADLLHARLEKQHPEDISALHLRASEWYRCNHQTFEAVSHALSARDYDTACRLIDGLVEHLIAQNGIGSLLDWIHQLPPEIATTHPWLCIAQAWSALFTNDVERIEPLLQTAEQNIHQDDQPILQDAWRGHIACLRAFVADMHADTAGAIEMAHSALDVYQLENPAHRAFAKYLLGRAYFIQGSLPQALETLTESVNVSIRAEATNIVAPTLSLLSKLYRIQGRLRESDEMLQEGEAYIERCNPQRVTLSGLVYRGQADNLRERNELESAENLGRHALELCEPWVNPTSICNCYALLGRVYQAQGQLSKAEEMLHAANESIRGHTPFSEVVSDLTAAWVGFWLATDQLPRASQWAQKQQASARLKSTFSINDEQDEITHARVLIAEGQLDTGIQSLEYLASEAETGQRFGRLIEILNLQVLASQAHGNISQALKLLQKSLALAEPEGYLRIFLDEHEPMQNLLSSYLRSGSSQHKSYVQKLLSGFTGKSPAIVSRIQSTDIVEPLTSREREVLQLLAEGCSNRQIAETLVLSEGTVKFHVHHILEKLQARTRSQAIAIARKQNLL
jgi:ATP-dependent transcriptional regulator